MRIGIIGPSKLNEDYKLLIAGLAKKLVDHEIVITADKGSSSEYFAKIYLENSGKKVYSVIPKDDSEFGYDWVNSIGEEINCGTWRNQPERLNEECGALVCLGSSVGGMIEIGYTKWFGKKPVYIIKDLNDEKLPKVMNEELDIRYVSLMELENEL